MTPNTHPSLICADAVRRHLIDLGCRRTRFKQELALPERAGRLAIYSFDAERGLVRITAYAADPKVAERQLTCHTREGVELIASSALALLAMPDLVLPWTFGNRDYAFTFEAAAAAGASLSSRWLENMVSRWPN